MPDSVMEGECKPVQLEPFVHQVGGHSSMLRFDDSTVCKPLISRERHFYEAMPPEMQEFVPEYRGVVEVTFHEDSNGYMTLVAYPPEYKKPKSNKRVVHPSSSPSSSGEGVQSDSDSESAPPPPRQNTQQRFRMRQSGSIEIEGMQDKMFQLVEPDSETDKEISKATHNPWSLRCHQEQLAKMKKNSKSSDVHKFILLENLACNFRLPCILDLKMGTRQHGDDASEEKRQKQIRKCAASTSSTLGFRICGMQVYQADTGHYICHNKYYGRRLSADGVEEALLEFLHNGYGLRIDLVDAIVGRLRKLYTMLAKQNKFRFYSSSLLIMYDGSEQPAVLPQSLRRTSPTSSPSAISSSVAISEAASEGADDARSDKSGDTDMCCSNRNCAATCRCDVGRDDDSAGGGGSGSTSAEVVGTCGSGAGRATDGSSTPVRSAPKDKANGKRKQCSVDVRMIDFAHATHHGFRGDRTVHTGPDNGYLFGLENIIRILESVKQHDEGRRS